MPPWVASVPRTTTLLRGRGIDPLPSIPYCRNATIARLSRPAHLRIRSASTHVSPTAINPRPEIPQRNVKLYNALSGLGSTAETFVNISRLQLALRGLAAQDAVIRVASKLYAEVGSTGKLSADCSYSIVNGTTENCSTASSVATCRPTRRRETMGARLGEGKRGWRACAVAVRLKLHKCEYIF
jgi:hypothetical protein